MRSNICTSILALFCAATTAQASLIVDPGFENNPLSGFTTVLSNFVADQGKWGAEAATISLATGGVVPPEGTKMLSMTGSGSTYQTAQVTNVSVTATDPTLHTLILSGGAIVNLNALFNTPSGVSSAGAGVIVTFLSGTNFNTDQISTISQSLTLDGDFNTWEQNSVSGAIPINTAWIVSQVTYNAASLGANPGFVDAASLTIAPVPEPGTALFGFACVGVAALRRRRSFALAAKFKAQS